MRILSAYIAPAGNIAISVAPGKYPSTPEATNYDAPTTPGPWIDAYVDMFGGEEQIMVSSSYSAADHMAVSGTHGRVGDFRVFRDAGKPEDVMRNLNIWINEGF